MEIQPLSIKNILKFIQTSYLMNTLGILDIQPSGIVMENGDFELEGSIDTKNDVDLDLDYKRNKAQF